MDSGVRSALMADPQLSERQKQVLMEIYELSAVGERVHRRGSRGPGYRGRPSRAHRRRSWGAEVDALEAALEAVAAMEAEAEAAQSTEP